MVGTKELLFRQIGIIGGKALMKPVVVAILLGDQVSKPLVGHFMGVDVYIIPVDESRGIYDKGIGKNRCARIFHSGIQKIVHRYLFVILPGIGYTDFGFEKVKNLFGIAIGWFHAQAVLWIEIVFDGNTTFRFQLLFIIFSNGKCQQITAHGLFHVELPRGQFIRCFPL